MALSKKFVESTKKELDKKRNRLKLLRLEEEQLTSEIDALQQVLSNEAESPVSETPAE